MNLLLLAATDIVAPGLAAIALYPPQAWLIPKLQRKINQQAKRRIQTTREFSDRIGDVIGGATEVRANDTMRYELADASSRLGTIYGIRVDIYKRKFFVKFLNNFLAQVTPFFFYAIGGYFVIEARDLNEAMQVAARTPSARFGSIEVRPCRVFDAA